MAGIPNVRLSLPNEPENVLVVRQVLSGLVEALDLEGLLLNSLSAAVSEACNNVVIHAYGGERGPLEVEIYAEPTALRVLVRDQGLGFLASPSGGEPAEYAAGGVGLLAIDALTERSEIRARAPAGTDVEMEFPTRALDELERATPFHALPLLADHQFSIEITPIALGRTILPRLLSALAARAHFPIDRISETMLLADALPSAIQQLSPGHHLRIGINIGPRSLELLIGPLETGHGHALVGDSSVAGLGFLLDRVTTTQSVIAAEAGEALALQLAAAAG
jgi:serine/threonine-protein kinase RsbW